MSEHIKRPWRRGAHVFRDESSLFTLFSGESEVVYFARPDGQPMATHEAVVDHIVHCVNSHDALVEACELALIYDNPYRGRPDMVSILTRAIADAEREMP